MRPAALMRGAMRNARSVAVRVRCAGSSLATCISERRPATGRTSQLLHPNAGDDAIFSQQRNRIGHRGDGQHLQKGGEDLAPRPLQIPRLEQCLRELEGYPGAAQVLAGVAAARLIRVEDSEGSRQTRKVGQLRGR